MVKGMAVGQHIVRWGLAVGLAEFLAFAFIHLAAAAIKHDKSPTGRFPAVHVLLEETALAEQFTFHRLYSRPPDKAGIRVLLAASILNYRAIGASTLGKNLSGDTKGKTRGKDPGGKSAGPPAFICYQIPGRRRLRSLAYILYLSIL